MKTVRILCEGDAQTPVLVTTVEGRLADDPWFGKTPLIVCRVHADANPLRSKSEVTAHLCSVEQQYWSLGGAHARLWAVDRAVELAEEILKSEQCDPFAGEHTADIAEVQERLKQFRLEFVGNTNDMIATERRLRNLMGLPANDRRRIVPITPHVKEPRSFPRQILDQATPSMARSFQEIAAVFEQLQTAIRDRETSLKRLEARRKLYDDGRILPDRYLDAVSQYASAVMEEYRFKTAYDIALACRDEARGTYLSARKIFLAVALKTVDADARVGGAEPTVHASGAGRRAN